MARCVRTGAPHKLPFSGRKHAANKAVLLQCRFFPTDKSIAGFSPRRTIKSTHTTITAAAEWEFRLLLVPRFASAPISLASRFERCTHSLAASKLLNGQPAWRHRRHQPLCAHAEVLLFCCFTECICFAPLYGFPRTITCRFSFTAEKIKIGSVHKGHKLCVEKRAAHSEKRLIDFQIKALFKG